MEAQDQVGTSEIDDLIKLVPPVKSMEYSGFDEAATQLVIVGLFLGAALLFVWLFSSSMNISFRPHGAIPSTQAATAKNEGLFALPPTSRSVLMHIAPLGQSFVPLVDGRSASRLGSAAPYVLFVTTDVPGTWQREADSYRSVIASTSKVMVEAITENIPNRSERITFRVVGMINHGSITVDRHSGHVEVVALMPQK
ncbi:MAG: hypothetical protein ACYDAG_10220 [Chloroflexota bacterium]